MTLEERAQCIADLAAPGMSYRGAERQRRVYERALKMLGEVSRECPACGCIEVTEEELLATLQDSR
jgi:hypothetical protein